MKRAEKEALERAEEEERKLKKKKEEEEFTKIPDDTINASGLDHPNTTHHLGMDQSDVQPKKSKKSGKTKGVEDNVNGQSSDDFVKKPRRKNKKAGQKGREDNLAGPSSKYRSSKTKNQHDTLVTNANPTTQGNFLNE